MTRVADPADGAGRRRVVASVGDVHEPGEFEVQRGARDRTGEPIDQESGFGRVLVEREALVRRELSVVGGLHRQCARDLEVAQRVIEVGAHGRQIEGVQDGCSELCRSRHRTPPNGTVVLPQDERRASA